MSVHRDGLGKVITNLSLISCNKKSDVLVRRSDESQNSSEHFIIIVQ